MLMKHIIYSYLVVSFLLLALVTLLSYGYGEGYIYIAFRGWQLQTNVWALLILLASISFIIQIFWFLIKHQLKRKQRKKEQVLNFQQLHPYEKLAILWLLEAEQEKKGMVQDIFTQSGLLKEVVQASFYWKQSYFNDALMMLDQSPPDAFELAELQRIELYLAQANGEAALSHLEFLAQHDLSPWLKEIEHGYQYKITTLWGKLAIRFPWLYLMSTQFGHLSDRDKELWLTQVLATFDQATFEDLENLKQRYVLLQDDFILSSIYENKLLWLKVLSRFPDMMPEQEELVYNLLQERFDSDVFYIWFEQQLLCANPNYQKIEQQINYWESKYTEIPVFSFAKWHIYQATDRQQEAKLLLTLYPNNVLMSYLRVKDKIQNDEVLVQELNHIFANDANFLKLNV